MTPDSCLDVHQIRHVLHRIAYRPGWSFTVHQHAHEGLFLRIVAEGLPDALNPGQTIDLGVDDWLPPIPDTAYLLRWLDWRIGRIDAHERREFLTIDGRRPFNPHPETDQ